MDDQQQPPPPPPSGDDSTFRDMTKTQLYEVMCEMKELIDQDKEQVRQILVDNPLLTRHLFQAQIMLGMVRPSQVTPNNQKASSDSQSTQVAPESEGQNFQPLPVEVGQHGPAISSSQPLVPARQQNPVETTPSAPSLVFQLPPNLSDAPLSAPEAKGVSNALVSPAATSQSSQIQGGPYVGPDYGNQVGTSMQSERAPWSSGMQERAMMGAQLLGPPPLSSIPPGHQMGQGVGSQPPRPPPLSREMEKSLLEQVMSLTPEQIHLLPAEQRQQVIQLQEMLRNVGGN